MSPVPHGVGIPIPVASKVLQSVSDEDDELLPNACVSSSSQHLPQ